MGLERRHNVFIAALITAVPFGFVHWPLAFFGDFTAASAAAALALYITLGLIFRPMIGVVLRGAGDSILVVAVLHSMFNRTNNADGIAATILTGDGRATAIPLAVILLTAVTALVVRRCLSRHTACIWTLNRCPDPSANTRRHADPGHPDNPWSPK